MRVFVASLTSAVAALLVAGALLVPEHVARFSVAGLLTVLIAVLAFGWPRIAGPKRRRSLSTITFATGAAAVWSTALISEGVLFSNRPSDSRPDLWLAPVGSALAIGVMLVFLAQLVIGAEKQDRPTMTSSAVMGLAMAASGAGWVLLTRQHSSPLVWMPELDEHGSLFLLGSSVAVGLALAGVVGLIPMHRGLRVFVMTVAATVGAVGLQMLQPQYLSIAAVLSAAVGGMIIGLVLAIVATEERHRDFSPVDTWAGIATGIAPVLSGGMILYFMVWLVPALI